VALNKNRLTISFEFFPPKTAEMEATLWRSIEHLAPLDPAFVSVTYGADGSTRDRTHNIVTRILRETHLTPAAHLTCVGATCEEIDAIAKRYWDAGVRHLVALRGDPPQGTGRYQPCAGGYPYAAELVAGLMKVGAFDKCIRTRRARSSISSISSARSTPARSARSRSSSSTSIAICASATAARPPRSGSRSCRGSCP
jgi:5,10-methylenetetrahydrofolate reductase